MHESLNGQTRSRGWSELCTELHRLLKRPALQRFSELRLKAAELLRGMQAEPAAQASFMLELLLLDVHSALYLCSPQDAVGAWRQLLDLQPPAGLDLATVQLGRARYIAAVQMLQAGLISADEAQLDERRKGLDSSQAADSLLVRAMLLDSLLAADSRLAMRACCLARSFEDAPDSDFERRFRQLCLALLEGRAEARQLALLLEASRDYQHWQLLDGPLWQACLAAEIIPLDNWKLHLEAHERCHAMIYLEITRAQ